MRLSEAAEQLGRITDERSMSKKWQRLKSWEMKFVQFSQFSALIPSHSSIYCLRDGNRQHKKLIENDLKLDLD